MNYTVHGILQARILGWAAFPFSRGSSQPRNQTQVSRIAGGFFTSWATREALQSQLPLSQKTQNINKWWKQYCKKFDKDLKNGPHPKKKKKAEEGLNVEERPGKQSYWLADYTQCWLCLSSAQGGENWVWRYLCLMGLLTVDSLVHALWRFPCFLSYFFFFPIIFGCTGSLLLCGLSSSCGKWGLLSCFAAQASHCGGFPCCRAQALGRVDLRSCDLQAQ